MKVSELKFHYSHSVFCPCQLALVSPDHHSARKATTQPKMFWIWPWNNAKWHYLLEFGWINVGNPGQNPGHCGNCRRQKLLQRPIIRHQSPPTNSNFHCPAIWRKSKFALDSKLRNFSPAAMCHSGSYEQHLTLHIRHKALIALTLPSWSVFLLPWWRHKPSLVMTWMIDHFHVHAWHSDLVPWIQEKFYKDLQWRELSLKQGTDVFRGALFFENRVKT
jgi:hypothetical protein